MTGHRAGMVAGAILLDIEGTITPVAFVTDILFPYARRHLRAYLQEHAAAADHQALIDRFRDEHQAALRGGEDVARWMDESDASRLASAEAFIEWLMERDRKSTPLKELQGKIWERGYQRGGIVGDVFPDVRPALERWRDEGVGVGIFSSGSVLAQQLLLRHSSAGDLSSLVRWHFDTEVGAKVESDSYRRIAESIGLPVASVLFLSDVPRELDAARQAGMQVRLAVRPGNAPVETHERYGTIQGLDEISNPHE